MRADRTSADVLPVLLAGNLGVTTLARTNNITPALMACGAVLVYTTIDVQHKINKSTTPRPLVWLLGSLSGINFAVINAFTALAVVRLQQRYYQIILIYMTGSFSVLLIIADVSVWQVRALILKFQDRSASAVKSKALAAEKSLYPLYAFVLFLNGLVSVVIAALIYQTVAISQANKQYDPPDRADPTQWKIDIFAWVHVVVIFVFVWWSWVPMHVLRSLLRQLGYEPTTVEGRTLGHPDGMVLNTAREAGHQERRGMAGRASGGQNQAILVQARTLVNGDSARSKRLSGSFNGKILLQLEKQQQVGGGAVDQHLPPSSHPSSHPSSKLLHAPPNLHAQMTLTTTTSQPSTPRGDSVTMLPGSVFIPMSTVNHAAPYRPSDIAAAAQPQQQQPAGSSWAGPGAGLVGGPLSGPSTSDVAEVSVSREADRDADVDRRLSYHEDPTDRESMHPARESRTTTTMTMSQTPIIAAGGASSVVGVGVGSSRFHLSDDRSPFSTPVVQAVASSPRPTFDAFTRQPLSISTSSRGAAAAGSGAVSPMAAQTPLLRTDGGSSSSPNGLTTNARFLLGGL